MMNLTLDGYVCPKCGYKIQYNLDVIKIRRPEEEIPEPIYIGGGKEDSLIVQRSCPECSNPEAYQSITVTIGEHSGVKTDRSIIRYKCTKCFHVWKDY
jgi:DNA-directed RNA polymerase subunit M/transcription elongation factor TFIIS